MTLDDAIKHCQQIAKESDCSECANEHKQLAQWLQELKEFKKIHTNEEWFCGLSTEEKAKVLNDLYWGFGYKAKLYYNLEPTKESFEKWLKQPHTTE